MKFTFSTFFAIFSLYVLPFVGQAQTKKSDIEQTLVELGMTAKDIKTLVLDNIIQSSSRDLTWRRAYAEFKLGDRKEFAVSLTDSGIKIFSVSESGGGKEQKEMYWISYTEIAYFRIRTSGYMEIYLRN